MGSDEQEIRDLIRRWLDATRAGDARTVLSLVAEDAIFLTAGRPPMTKAAFAAALTAQSKSGAPVVDGISDIQEIRIAGDWAFLWTELRVELRPPGGAPKAMAGHTLSVLKRQDGKWLLARDANLLVSVDHGSNPGVA